MGWGDELMGSGMARGLYERGKLAAFGNGNHIFWTPRAREIFRGNRNVAEPGAERDPAMKKRLEWIPFFKGSRIYNRQRGDRWEWNMNFRPQRGEIFLTPDEEVFANRYGKDFVLIEPNVPREKDVAPNKQWPVERYQAVAFHLIRAGYRVAQFGNGPHLLGGVERLKSPTFRHGLAILRNARLYIGPEGGLHHGAAAVGIPAVVIFGGFIPASVTGYEGHANLTAGEPACGRFTRCQHCIDAMALIPVARVLEEAIRLVHPAGS